VHILHTIVLEPIMHHAPNFVNQQLVDPKQQFKGCSPDDHLRMINHLLPQTLLHLEVVQPNFPPLVFGLTCNLQSVSSPPWPEQWSLNGVELAAKMYSEAGEKDCLWIQDWVAAWPSVPEEISKVGRAHK
jgi:hypothetical protein